MPNHYTRDHGDTTNYQTQWWELISRDSPKPYATASWSYFQTVTELDEAEEISE